MEDIVAESRAFLADIVQRLPPPQPHIGHGHLSAWFEAAKERMKEPPGASSKPPAGDIVLSASPPPAAPPRNLAQRVSRAMLGGLRRVYQSTFGVPPTVGRFHPLWLDTCYVTHKIAGWNGKRARVLWLTSRDSLFHTMLQKRIDTAALFLAEPNTTLFAEAPYDACLCELTADELATLNDLYARIRPIVKNAGEVLFFVSGKRNRLLAASDVALCETAFPDVDMSEIRFFGSAVSEMLRRTYLRASRSFPNRPICRAVATGAVLIGLAPVVRAVNAIVSRRDPLIFASHWTTIVVRFTVKKGATPRAAGTLGTTRDVAVANGPMV
jgi:hypothetical protein